MPTTLLPIDRLIIEFSGEREIGYSNVIVHFRDYAFPKVKLIGGSVDGWYMTEARGVAFLERGV